MTTVAIYGCGAVGSRAARQLLAASTADRLVLFDRNRERAVDAARVVGGQLAVRVDVVDDEPSDGSIVVLATPVGTHVEYAQRAVQRGAAVVSLTDGVIEVQMLQALDAMARQAGVPLVIGAGFSPGLTCVLARFGAAQFDRVDELHVAKVGTGGPACARQHHRALASWAYDWRDREWLRRAGGSGRELLWFPEPVMARDCYRAALAEPFLLAPSFAHCARITARMAATRRDRLTAGLPMLVPPHTEGGVGAVRVELRGGRDQALAVEVFGAADRPAVAAAAVAAAAVEWVRDGRVPPGAHGLAALEDPAAFLRALRRRGGRFFRFDGHARPAVSLTGA